MMDVSDGLSTDLGRLCKASGVGARVWESLLPVPVTDGLPAARRLDPLHLTLHGGEDYQLLFAASSRVAGKLPPEICGVELSHIGVIDRGNAVRLIRASGRVEPLRPAGFDHFRQPRT